MGIIHDMKKILAALLAIMLFGTCAMAEPGIRIAALKGPTAMGMAPMMSSVDQTEATPYAFTIAASADEITPQLIQGKLDIAAVPANLAAILYNNTQGAIQVLAINTLGVLYIAERGDSVQTVADLRGKTLYTAGKGSTPEFALNFILRENGLDPETDVRIEYKSEHSECLAAILQDADAVAMLPQPFATIAQSKAEDMRIALDLTAEWDKLNLDSTMITGVVIARTEWLQAHSAEADAFLDDYQASVDFVNANTLEAAEMIGDLDIVTAEVAEKALPYCNITFIAGEDMLNKLSGYLNVLYDQDANAVGGKLPDEAFYYIG